MAEHVLELNIGSRVLDKDDYRGTVCYIGPVATSKSQETIYAGIKWDDITRGRNDGSVVTTDGVVHRYFQCTQGAGSFVKIELVKTGTDFLSALRQRYEDDSSSGKVETGSIVGISGHSVPILLVGDEKIRAQQVSIANIPVPIEIWIYTDAIIGFLYADFAKTHARVLKWRECFSNSTWFYRRYLPTSPRSRFAWMPYLQVE